MSESAQTSPDSAPVSLILAICTFQRNEALRHLLSTVLDYARAQTAHYELGVVVVDDSSDQQARTVVEAFEDGFDRGIHYRHSGRRNISLARNLAIETAADLGDWIAMTDDDCEPSEQWLGELLRVQRATGADIVTGPLIRRAPENAPRWLKEQPFLNVTSFDAETGTELELAFTNNSMIPARLLDDERHFRFDPAFGRIGGEDMVFYRAVAKAGYRIVFARDARVFENEDHDRLSLGYQFRRHYWLGNSSVQTMLRGGSSRSRMAIHGAATIARAAVRPFSRMLRGEAPQFLYGAAKLVEGAGKLSGAAGVKVSHK